MDVLRHRCLFKKKQNNPNNNQKNPKQHKKPQTNTVAYNVAVDVD